MLKLRKLGVVLAAVVALAACDDATGPTAGSGRAAVSLSLMVPGAGGAAPAAGLFAASELTLTDGTNTLVIQSAEVVLREIEFERVDDLAGCDADEGEIEGSDDDSCEEFKTEPILLALPLDGSVDQQISVEVDTGTYDEIEFDVHKVSGDSLDQAFLDQYPEFAGLSVRVIGTWNGAAFEYASDLDAEQEIELATPMVVDENAGPINVTLSVDVSTWFKDLAGALIDPNSALKNGPNEEVVEDNIEASIEGFEDDDGDGVPHEEDEDESDGSL